MRPARRLLPPMGGLDLSPIAVLLVLGVLLRLLVAPLEHLGVSLL
jgi:YggT family protein